MALRLAVIACCTQSMHVAGKNVEQPNWGLLQSQEGITRLSFCLFKTFWYLFFKLTLTKVFQDGFFSRTVVFVFVVFFTGIWGTLCLNDLFLLNLLCSGVYIGEESALMYFDVTFITKCWRYTENGRGTHLEFVESKPRASSNKCFMSLYSSCIWCIFW